MSDSVDPPKPVVVTGRTPYDAAVEIIRSLGRAAPWFVFLAGFLYAAQQIYAVDQSKDAAVQKARLDAKEEQNKQITALNDRLSANDKSLEELRGQQMTGLKQLLDLTQSITAAIAKSQTDLMAQREALFSASKQSQEAQMSLDASRAKTRDLEAQRDELKKESAKARDIMDSAARILNYLGDRGEPSTDRTALSRLFENNDPSLISSDSKGKYFYGAFRLPGDEMGEFLAWLDKQDTERASPLLEVGGGPAAAKGELTFQDAWAVASRDRTFVLLQSHWIDTKRYEPFIKQLSKFFPGFDEQAFAKRSVALQAVLWSVVNQHGRVNVAVRNAWAGLQPATESELVLICKIYAEERRNTRIYFPDQESTTYTLLEARYRFELEEALRMLKVATKTTDDPKCE